MGSYKGGARMSIGSDIIDMTYEVVNKYRDKFNKKDNSKVYMLEGSAVYTPKRRRHKK